MVMFTVISQRCRANSLRRLRIRRTVPRQKDLASNSVKCNLRKRKRAVKSKVELLECIFYVFIVYYKMLICIKKTNKIVLKLNLYYANMIKINVKFVSCRHLNKSRHWKSCSCLLSLPPPFLPYELVLFSKIYHNYSKTCVNKIKRCTLFQVTKMMDKKMIICTVFLYINNSWSLFKLNCKFTNHYADATWELCAHQRGSSYLFLCWSNCRLLILLLYFENVAWHKFKRLLWVWIFVSNLGYLIWYW